jgi:hypothetical protein
LFLFVGNLVADTGNPEEISEVGWLIGLFEHAKFADLFVSYTCCLVPVSYILVAIILHWFYSDWGQFFLWDPTELIPPSFHLGTETELGSERFCFPTI